MKSRISPAWLILFPLAAGWFPLLLESPFFHESTWIALALSQRQVVRGVLFPLALAAFSTTLFSTNFLPFAALIMACWIIAKALERKIMLHHPGTAVLFALFATGALSAVATVADGTSFGRSFPDYSFFAFAQLVAGVPFWSWLLAPIRLEDWS